MRITSKALLLATALALSSTSTVLATDTNFIVRLSPNGTVTWPAPTDGADRYHVQSSGTLLDWAGLPGLTNIFPTAATQGRFSFSLPGFSGTVAPQQFYRVLAEGLAGETCAGAELLSFPTAVQHTTAGYRDDTSAYLSLPALSGPERHYRIRLPGQWLLTATLMPAAGFDPALVLLSATNCGATPLPALAATDVSGAGGGETLLWSNATPAMVDVILAVDSAGTSGAYALELAAESLLPGDSPFAPQSLPGAGIYLGTTVGYANDITSGMLCQGTAGLDHFYRITVSAGKRLLASVEPTGSSFDPSINLLRPPAAGQTVFACLAGDDSGSASTRNQVLFNNPGLGPEDVLIAIDTSSSLFGGGPYRLEVQLPAFPAGDVPRGAQVLSGPGTVNGSLTDYVNDLTSYPGWSSLPGRDRFYRVAVPAGQRVVATLTPSGFNAALAVLDAAAFDATNLLLLAAADASTSTSGAETAAWFNATAASRDVILSVDTDSASAQGSFTLAVQFNVPPAGDVPPTAELLAGPGTVSGTTVGFLNDALLYPGLASQPGNDRFYRLTVPAGLRLAATVSNVSFNASIVVLDAGAAASGTLEVLAFANDSTSLSGAEKVFWLNAAGTNREVVIAVESPVAGAGGAFTLTTDVAEVPPGETPLTAELLAGAGPVTGAINGYANDLVSYPTWQSLPGPDRFFRVTVPAGGRLVASLTPSGFDAALGLLDASPIDASNAVVVLAAANFSSSTANAETAGWLNVSGQSRDVIVAVETFTLPGLAGGSFTLALELGLPPVGERPQTAELLTGPGTVPGTTLGYLNDVPTYPGFGSYPGNDRFYRLSVPPGLRLSATVSNVSFNAAVVILDGAAAVEGGIATLTLANLSSSSTGAETAFWLNLATTNREVVIGVESPSAGAGGTYTLTTLIAAPPSGDSPFAPEALPGPGTYTGTTTNYANDVASGATCASLNGADRYYLVSVPAGERLRASLASATADLNPSLNLLRPPSPGQTIFSCLVGDDTGDWTTTNSVIYLNTNAAAENILIAIDTASLAALGDFSLTIEIGPPPPPPPGEFPQTAEVLSGPGTITGSTTNYANNLNMPSLCTGTRTPGWDRFYQILVPAGKELVATVTPIGFWDPAIYLIRASHATNPNPACLSGADQSDDGAPEWVNYVNNTTSDELLVIGVDSYSLFHSGNFTLETILMP